MKGTGTGLAAGQPAATAQALGQVAEGMAVMQAMVRDLFPADDDHDLPDAVRLSVLTPRDPVHLGRPASQS